MIRHVTCARGVTEPSRHALRSRSARQDKTRQYLLTYTLTNYRACMYAKILINLHFN